MKHWLQRLTAFLVLLMLLMPFPAFAENFLTTQDPLLEGSISISKNAYVLGPGDVLKINDENMGVLIDNLKVLPDGTIQLPLIGEVSVKNHSLPEVEHQLDDLYQKYFLHPTLSIQIVTQRPFKIYVTGAVKNPGVFTSGTNYNSTTSQSGEIGGTTSAQIHNNVSLSEALMLAGGLNLNADIRHITVKRSIPGNETFQLNLWDLLEGNKQDQDIALQDQDMIEVPEIPVEKLLFDKQWDMQGRSNISINTFTVNVLGAVKNPGHYPVKSSETVDAALALAGGFTNIGNPGKIHIIRMQSSGEHHNQLVDLEYPIFNGNKPLTDLPKLYPQDLVYVEESTSRKTLSYVGKLLSSIVSPVVYIFLQRWLYPPVNP